MPDFHVWFNDVLGLAVWGIGKVLAGDEANTKHQLLCYW